MIFLVSRRTNPWIAAFVDSVVRTVEYVYYLSLAVRVPVVGFKVDRGSVLVEYLAGPSKHFDAMAFDIYLDHVRSRD